MLSIDLQLPRTEPLQSAHRDGEISESQRRSQPAAAIPPPPPLLHRLLPSSIAMLAVFLSLSASRLPCPL